MFETIPVEILSTYAKLLGDVVEAEQRNGTNSELYNTCKKELDAYVKNLIGFDGTESQIRHMRSEDGHTLSNGQLRDLANYAASKKKGRV